MKKHLFKKTNKKALLLAISLAFTGSFIPLTTYAEDDEHECTYRWIMTGPPHVAELWGCCSERPADTYYYNDPTVDLSFSNPNGTTTQGGNIVFEENVVLDRDVSYFTEGHTNDDRAPRDYPDIIKKQTMQIDSSEELLMLENNQTVVPKPKPIKIKAYDNANNYYKKLFNVGDYSRYTISLGWQSWDYEYYKTIYRDAKNGVYNYYYYADIIAQLYNRFSSKKITISESNELSAYFALRGETEYLDYIAPYKGLSADVHYAFVKYYYYTKKGNSIEAQKYRVMLDEYKESLQPQPTVKPTGGIIVDEKTIYLDGVARGKHTLTTTVDDRYYEGNSGSKTETFYVGPYPTVYFNTHLTDANVTGDYNDHKDTIEIENIRLLSTYRPSALIFEIHANGKTHTITASPTQYKDYSANDGTKVGYITTFGDLRINSSASPFGNIDPNSDPYIMVRVIDGRGEITSEYANAPSNPVKPKYARYDASITNL